MFGRKKEKRLNELATALEERLADVEREQRERAAQLDADHNVVKELFQWYRSVNPSIAQWQQAQRAEEWELQNQPRHVIGAPAPEPELWPEEDPSKPVRDSLTLRERVALTLQRGVDRLLR